MNPDKNLNYEHFFSNIDSLKDKIIQEQSRLTDLLIQYEPLNTVQDELERSLEALDGVRAEFSTINVNIHDLKMATFFPLNLPLYSLVLFAVIPSAFADRVLVRAPSIMNSVIEQLVNMLDLKNIFPEVRIKNVHRSIFLNLYANSADIILFTGRYENAIKIQQQCPHALLLFNGGGVNPAIVFEDADVSLTANKLIEMRIFNSGQDCAGTDVIFVHENVRDEFVNLLNTHLDNVIVGSYGNPATQIGPILRKEYIDGLEEFLGQEKAHIIRKGSIDKELGVVHPYVILKSADEHTNGFHEFFAPVFYILTFKTSEELTKLLLQPQVQDFSMYVSYFGNNPIVQEITKAKLLHNLIVNDVERGNSEYGGYGEKANFVAFGDTIASRPILISREVNDFYINDGIVKPLL